MWRINNNKLWRWNTVLCDRCSDKDEISIKKADTIKKENQPKTETFIKGLKLMVLGVAIMLLGGFSIFVINSGYELILVIVGFFITLHGYFQ